MKTKRGMSSFGGKGGGGKRSRKGVSVYALFEMLTIEIRKQERRRKGRATSGSRRVEGGTVPLSRRGGKEWVI